MSPMVRECVKFGTIMVPVVLMMIWLATRNPDGKGEYCYKGHDEPFISNDGGHYVQFVCDDMRDTHFKYDSEQGASSNGVSK